MFQKEIYLKRTSDIKELLESLKQCPDEAFIQVEEFPSSTFTDKDGNTQALFKVYIDEIDVQFFISRRLKEWLVEKEILLP